jgi:type II secretory pathway pseudopilin PulG
MIEILVVIGIIAALTAMLFLGFKYVGKSSRDNQTHVMLQNLRGMLTEYETSGGSMDRLEDGYRQPPNTATADFPATLTIKAPSGSVLEDMPSRNAAAIQQTGRVMSLILAVPSNQKIVDSLPANQVWRTSTGILLLDGFRNPILFVPRRGMAGVNLVKTGDIVKPFASPNQTIASPGAKTITAGTPTTPPVLEGRPFFASAGEDADFSLGDDNRYSYDQ